MGIGRHANARSSEQQSGQAKSHVNYSLRGIGGGDEKSHDPALG